MGLIFGGVSTLINLTKRRKVCKLKKLFYITMIIMFCCAAAVIYELAYRQTLNVAWIHVLASTHPSWNKPSQGLSPPRRVVVSSCVESNRVIHVTFIPSGDALGLVCINDISLNLRDNSATAYYCDEYLDKAIKLQTNECHVYPLEGEGTRLSAVFDIPRTGVLTNLPMFVSRYLVNMELRHVMPWRSE